MSLLPPSPLLDETIVGGQPAHIADHETIHHILNNLNAATLPLTPAGFVTAANVQDAIEQSTVVMYALAWGVTFDNVTIDTAAWNSLIDDIPLGGARIVCPVGTSLVDSSALHALPSGTHIQGQGWGNTVIKCVNRTTWVTDPGVQYTFIAANGATDIEIEGLTGHGNRSNGNHSTFAGAENFDFLWCSTDNKRIVVHHCRFTNFRGDVMYVNRSASQPEHIWFVNNLVDDCGIKEVGDGGNARMGVAFICGNDILVALNVFDTIGAFAVDCEGNGVGDNFDGVTIGLNRYRDVGSGAVNVTTPGTVTNLKVYDDPIAGTTGSVAYSIPATQKRTQTVRRTSGSLTFNNTTWGGLAGSAGLTATLFDIVLPAKPNDIIEVTISAWWSDTNAVNGALDIATLDAGAALVNYFSTADSGGSDYGVAAWMGITGQRTPAGGAITMILGTADIVSGFATLRPYCRVDGAASRSIRGTKGAGAGPCFQFVARNLGPQG